MKLFKKDVDKKRKYAYLCGTILVLILLLSTVVFSTIFAITVMAKDFLGSILPLIFAIQSFLLVFATIGAMIGIKNKRRFGIYE